eukprot:scaffold8736_cov114-Isochrysis_galbana.AAC.2
MAHTAIRVMCVAIERVVFPGRQGPDRVRRVAASVMEQTPADARAAPSASAPNDIVMDIHSSPKRPRDPAQDNMVSQRATPFAPAQLESTGSAKYRSG